MEMWQVMEFKTEEEFLKAYDKNDYDLLSMTTDILILSVSNSKNANYRKLGQKYFSVLLVKRNTFPFKGKWCVPGGFLGIDEDLEDNARKILEKETNLHGIYLEQLYTFGAVNRDPRMRVVSTSFMALIDKERLNQQVCQNAKWFNIKIEEENENFENKQIDENKNEALNKIEKQYNEANGSIINVTLKSDDETIKFKIKKTLKETTTDKFKFEVIENDSLAFDHPLVIYTGIERLKNKIEYTDIVFNLMPPLFTLGELKQVYEVILNKKLLDANFRRIIASKVVKTDEVQTGGGHRPSILYRYMKG